jgi:hypothetical protein
VGEHFRKEDDPAQPWWPRYLSLGAVANPILAIRRMWRSGLGRLYLGFDVFFALVFLQQTTDGADRPDGPIALAVMGLVILTITLVFSGEVLKSRQSEDLARREDAFVLLGWYLLALALADLVT